MSKPVDQSMTLTMRNALEQSERELQNDVDLQRQLQQIRNEALTHIPSSRRQGLQPWMMGGALACAAVVAFSILFLPLQPSPALESELVMELDSYGLESSDLEMFELEPEFYDWAVESVSSVDS